MKSFFCRALMFCCALLFFCVGGCHHGHCAEAPGAFRALASTFPVYLFTINVCQGASNVEVELLVPASAGCPHDFALKPADMARLDKASVLIINGLGLEEYLDKALQAVKIPRIDASAGVPVIAGNEPGHVNPHIFAAPFQASLMVKNIAAALAAQNPENAAIYGRNGEALARNLAALAKKFADVGAKAINRRIAIEHDALAYLALNSGLEIAAIIEHGASAASLARLEAALKKDKPALLAGEEQYSDRLLQMLSSSTGVPFALLDTCASGPENPPLDYYQTVMAKNLDILEKYFD